MTLQELYAEVSRRTDTDGTQINAADTSRVCAKLFEVLAEQAPPQLLQLVQMGIQKHYPTN